MTERHYNFSAGPAKIEQHSIAKHAVLRAYLARYFETLASTPNQDVMRLTLVDGFAGGGQYQHADTGELVPGSPFICLDAVRDAEIALNLGRRKPLKLDVQYFFVEKERSACQFLERLLREKDLGARLGQDIHLRHAAFEDQADAIIKAIKAKSPRIGRSIFVLDQYGYRDVPGSLVQKIFAQLPRAEIVLTFAVDALLNFHNDGPASRQVLADIGLGEVFAEQSFETIRASERHWRLFIQSKLCRHLIDRCGAKHFTPFFIRNSGGHGDYWLIHLSQHPRARDVMTEVHWHHHNHFIHFGDAGLDMFQMVGYDPEHDDRFLKQQPFGFEFDNIARSRSVETLKEQFPRHIAASSEGVTFGELFASTCNTSPASAEIYREALTELIQAKLVTIKGDDGVVRRSANQIQAADRIVVPSQRDLFFS